MIIWITGLSGAGKSTIARKTVEQLKAKGFQTVFVDGDEVRWVVQDPHTAHDRESRLVNAYRICRLAKLLEGQGFVVVVATMSLFHEIHDWNRQNFQAYFEVLVEVPPDVLQQRDARGLYSRLNRGEAQHVVGFDLEIEVPQAPHLIVDNSQEVQDFEMFAAHIIAQWESHQHASLK